MAVVRTLEIVLDDVAVGQLVRRDLRLVVVKAIATNSPAATPIVWFDAPIQRRQRLVWGEALQAWTAPTTPADDAVRMRRTLAVRPGERFESRAGLCHVRGGSLPFAVELHNPGATEQVGGLAQQVNGTMAPICAMPLFSGNLVDIEPRASVALMFAPDAWRAGRRMTVAPTHGLLIDEIDAATVRWDTRRGWSVTGAAALPLAAETPLRGCLAGAPDPTTIARRAQQMRGLDGPSLAPQRAPRPKRTLSLVQGARRP